MLGAVLLLGILDQVVFLYKSLENTLCKSLEKRDFPGHSEQPRQDSGMSRETHSTHTKPTALPRDLPGASDREQEGAWEQGHVPD